MPNDPLNARVSVPALARGTLASMHAPTYTLLKTLAHECNYSTLPYAIELIEAQWKGHYQWLSADVRRAIAKDILIRHIWTCRFLDN